MNVLSGVSLLSKYMARIELSLKTDEYLVWGLHILDANFRVDF